MDLEKANIALLNAETELMCFVCDEWCNSPVRISVCGHYFCSGCLDPSETECPKCKEVFNRDDIENNHLFYQMKNDINFFKENLYDACKNLEQMKLSLELPFELRVIDFSFSKRNAKGESELHLACKRRKLDEVKKVLSKEVDVNCKDFADWTPLHEAIQVNNVEIVQELLKHNPLIDSPGECYITPLHKAVQIGNIEMIKLLIRKAASKTALDFYGRTPSEHTMNTDILNILNDSEAQSEALKPRVYINKKIVGYCHGIDEKYKAMTSTIDDLTIVNEFNLKKHKITHLFVKKTHKPSLKILLSIVGGLFIVRQEWIETFKNGTHLIPTEFVLENYNEISRGIKASMVNHLMNRPKLFDKVNFFLEIPDKQCQVYNLTFNKDFLSVLITSGGGKVLSRAPAPRTVEQVICYPFHGADRNSSAFGCCNFIIYDNDNPPALQYKMKELRHMSSKWLIDCVLNFKLL